MSLHGILLDEINRAHAKQLAQFELPSPGDFPEEKPPDDLFSGVEGWIEANPSSIKAAQANQCKSVDPASPNWDAILFSLAESSAVYLRNFEEVVCAIKAAHEGHIEQAMEHIKEAQKDIDKVAELLGCTFVQLCDFASTGPDGSFFLAGAYCGLFISNNIDKPFMGIVYKGTNNMREVKTNWSWRPVSPKTQDVAWNAMLHQGFYLGLFGKFKKVVVPFDLMFQELSIAYKLRNKALLHFTGHSLGGAYCTLTYGEFLRRKDEPGFKDMEVGDMYSLAAPRVALEPFASKVNENTANGSKRYLFRIVNRLDPVCTIPPPTASQKAQYPFIHVGGAWEISKEGAAKLKEEPPAVNPQPIKDIIWNIKYHQGKDYYASWQKIPRRDP